MERNKKIKVRNNKIESVAQTAGDNVIAGVVIANIITDVANNLVSIAIGCGVALLLYAVSYFFGLFNSTDD